MIKRKLNLEWVSNVIGDDYKNWSKGDWIKIQAQAGTGKTYFIITKLIYGLDYDEKALILCNRIALKRQMKIDLLKSIKEDVPKKKKGKSEVIDYDTLDKMIDFGNVRIMSYQQLGKQYKKNVFEAGHKYNLENYKYIINDECHFFYSDGKFNSDTEFALKQILGEGRMSIKIFISATMGKLDKLIDGAVDKFGLDFIFKKSNLYKYSTGTDYTYLNFKYFFKLKALATVINNDKSDKKWLVFVNSDYERKQLCSMLECDYDYINADRKNSKQFKNIIDDCKFTCKVLISTTVIDNGVNIKDDDLVNLVLMCKDWTTFIQEIGRIRFENIDNKIHSNEINLYLMIRSKNDFKKVADKHKFVDEQLKLYKEDKNKFNYRFCDFDRKTPCKDYLNMIFRNGKESGKWEISSLGLDVFNDEKLFINNMIDNFNENYKQKEEIEMIYEDGKWIGIPEYSFVEAELKWLFPNWQDKKHSDSRKILSEMLQFEINTIDNKIKEDEVLDLKSYLEESFNNKVVMLTKADRNYLIEKIGLYDTNHSKFFSGLETLNSYISESGLPYQIKEFETSRMVDGKKKKFKNAWKLEFIQVESY